MTFSIFYDKQPLNFLKKQDEHAAGRILDKLEETLSNNPVPHNVKTMIGEHGVFRMRIGDYRVIYRINYQERKIVVFKIDKRSQVYK